MGIFFMKYLSIQTVVQVTQLRTVMLKGVLHVLVYFICHDCFWNAYP